MLFMYPHHRHLHDINMNANFYNHSAYKSDLIFFFFKKIAIKSNSSLLNKVSGGAGTKTAQKSSLLCEIICFLGIHFN